MRPRLFNVFGFRRRHAPGENPVSRGRRRVLFACLDLLILLWAGCSRETPSKKKAAAKSSPAAPIPQPTKSEPREPLPEGIVWLTNTSDPVFASPQASRGGTLHLAISDFPLTFRTVGPDANNTFRSAILDNQFTLIDLHPDTLNIIPELATHWAFGADKKTMYFKLDPNARWSDGVPVTADDYAYTLEFMRSKYIIAPWYNDFYTKEIDRVIVYDDHTLAMVATKANPDLDLYLNIYPLPRHFYGTLGDDFVRKYNWAAVPNTGAYQIEKFRKGRYIRFKRKPDWWANDLRYFKNRFNVDTVLYKVIRDSNLQWEYFKKGKLDQFVATMPTVWHIKTKTDVVEKGYVDKMWFFNDVPQPSAGFYLNEDRDIFKDPNLRYAFAHAMNVGKVIRDVLHNDYMRLEQGYVGYGEYTNPNIKARRYDIAKVEAYMHTSGWQRGSDGIWTKNGRRYSVELVYSYDQYTKRLVVFKEEARKAGIELNLQLLDDMACYKKVMEKHYDVAYWGWSTSLRPQFWEGWHSDNAHKPQTNNITNADNPELDNLIDRYRNSLEKKERIALAWRIEALIHEDGSYVPTFMVPYFRDVYWRWWRLPEPPATRSSDSLFSPFSSQFGGLFWFDPDLYKETEQARREGKTFPPVTRKDTTYEHAAEVE